MLGWRSQLFKTWITSTGHIKRCMTSVECIRRRKTLNHVSARLISCTMEEIRPGDAGRWKGVIRRVFISLPRNLTGAFLCITEGLELCEECFWSHLRTHKYSYPLSSRSSLFTLTVTRGSTGWRVVFGCRLSFFFFFSPSLTAQKSNTPWSWIHLHP